MCPLIFMFQRIRALSIPGNLKLFQPIVKSRPFIPQEKEVRHLPVKFSSSKVVPQEVPKNLKKQGADKADTDKSYKVESDVVDKPTVIAKDIPNLETKEIVSGPYSKKNTIKKDVEKI